MTTDIARETPAMAELRSIANDLLEGADEIALFIYGAANKRRRVYHLAATSNLPVFRMGAVLCARKSRILDWIKGQEADADVRVQRLAEGRRLERVKKVLAVEKNGSAT